MESTAKHLIRRMRQSLPDLMRRDRAALSAALQAFLRNLGSADPSAEKMQNLQRLAGRFRAATEKAHARKAARPVLRYPASLPILARRRQIVEAISSRQVVIVSGETGSGKTTQIPKFCIEAGRGLQGVIGCTQPRRVAAVTIAQRIAEEIGETVGRSVGYKIRFEERSGREPFIKVMTDGILLMEMQADPFLNSYDTIIIDEAHERSLNIDFAFGALKNLLARRTDLKLLIASATIDVEKFAGAFDGAAVFEVSGRTYPVETVYIPPEEDSEQEAEAHHVVAAVRAACQLASREEPGDILIFMPTEEDIRDTCELLRGQLAEDAEILPLYARLAAGEQRRVFREMSGRKIVVATNIAETSITIPGIRFVIDSGLARISVYNARSRTTSLPIRPVSRSSADQRKGRCGRVREGVCIRLYSEEDYLSRPPYTAPEILRSNLSAAVLRMLRLGVRDVDAFPFLDPPQPRLTREALDELVELGAVAADGDATGREEEPPPIFRLTPRGRRMAELPVDPRISRMILEAQPLGCLDEILVIAAALSIADPRERPLEQAGEADRMHALFAEPGSDFLTLLKLWRQYHDARKRLRSQNALRRFCREHFLSFRRMKEWCDVHGQIREKVAEVPGIETSPALKPPTDLPERISRSILSGCLAQIACRKEKNLYTSARGKAVSLHPSSVLFNRGGEWIVAAEMVETSRLFARTAANIRSDWLEEIGGDLCRYSYSEPRWDAAREQVVATERVILFSLLIVPGRAVPYGRIDAAEAGRIFIHSALMEGEVRRIPPFLEHNLALIDRVRTMENKLRRRDLLTDDECIFSFYETRIPGIFDMKTLGKTIRERGGDAFLRMREEDLLRRPPEQERLEMFPDEASLGGSRVRFEYRFEPGTASDGVTMHVPLPSLAAIAPERIENLVPGLRLDKVAAMLKALPKDYRRKLQPLAQTTEIVLRELDDAEGPLTHRLGRFLASRFGVHVPAQVWREIRTEDRLRMHFSVVDDGNRVLASGDDVRVLQEDFVADIQSRAFAAARAAWEKKDLRDWTIGDLPDSVPLKGESGWEGLAYPALASEGNGVHLWLFPTAAEAWASHPRGVMNLYALRFREVLAHLRKSLAIPAEWKKTAAVFGAGVVEKAAYEKVLHELFYANIRSQKHFHEHGEAVKGRILSCGQEILRLVEPVVRAYFETHELLRRLEGTHRFRRAELLFIQSLQKEKERLVPADFLLRYERERLPHLVRYLRALAVRSERGLANLERDRLREEEIRPFLDFHRKAVADGADGPPSGEKMAALEEFRWMVEEYRVSLHAQELKTAFPVSRKRLLEKMQTIEEMT